MALSQRPAARFFAAFYRWNHHTRNSHKCAVQSARSGAIRPSTRLHARPYHAIRSLRRQEPSAAERDDPFTNLLEAAAAPAKRQPPKGGGARSNDEPREAAASVIKQPPKSGGARSDDEPREAAGVEDESPLEAEKLRTDVRKLMRQVTSTVAVVTAASFDPELNQNVPLGVAVSSLSTVTLDPPMISFNIKQPSNTLDAIRAAGGRFRVHFPSADRRGATIVDSFSRGNHTEAYRDRLRTMTLYIPNQDPKSDTIQIPASRAPQIIGNSVRAAMECTTTQELQVADHVILVASIDDVESFDGKNRPVTYVDGIYLRDNASKLATHGELTEAPIDPWSVWDYPIQVGDVERRDYMERIQKLIKATPGVSRNREHLRRLESQLPLSPNAIGINLEQIVADMAPETEPPAHLRVSSPLLEFWGRLPPSARSKINSRAKNLIAENSAFLSLNYRVFLQYLGVSSASIDLLPGDIAAPLREAGLLEPFHLRTDAAASDSRNYTLEYLEQLEHRLVEHMKSKGHQEIERLRLGDIVVTLGESRQAASFFNKARARLYTIAFPELFTPDEIDIAGDISPEEARVVMSRVLKYLRADHPVVFQRHLNNDYREILRGMRVDPTITGFNVEFFFGKIRHVHASTRSFQRLAKNLYRMVGDWFADTVNWEDLEQRVTEFVYQNPWRAMAWTTRDQLAAMGLSYECVLTVDIASNNQPLKRGHIMDTLVAKTLKGMYNEPETEPLVKHAIAIFLKERYNYDIDPANPVQVDWSSSAEMREAMRTNREVNVRRQWFMKRLVKEQVIEIQSRNKLVGKQKEKPPSSYSLLSGKRIL